MRDSKTDLITSIVQSWPQSVAIRCINVRTLCALWLLVVLGNRPAGAQDESFDTPSKVASFVVAGMKNELAKVTSGEFRAIGKRTESFGLERIGVENRDQILEVEGDGAYGWTKQEHIELIFDCAFDWDAQRHRVDRTEKSLVPANLPPGVGDGRETAKQSTFRWARDSDHIVLWSSRSPQIITLDTLDAKDVSAYMPRLDVRTVPVAIFRRLRHLEADFIEWWKTVETRRTVLAAVKEQSGLYRIVWSHVDASQAKGELGERYSVWFDPMRGYVPVRMEVDTGAQNAKPSIVSETTWTSFAGV